MAGSCPRCGANTLFDGLLAFAPSCRQCGFDFTQLNVGDGAAAFGTLIVGGIAVIGAVIMEIMWSPPFWVQALVWLPFVTVATIIFIRIAKSMLAGAEYRNAAREGRLKQ